MVGTTGIVTAGFLTTSEIISNKELFTEKLDKILSPNREFRNSIIIKLQIVGVSIVTLATLKQVHEMLIGGREKKEIAKVIAEGLFYAAGFRVISKSTYILI